MKISEDGTAHINIYSKGATEIGRYLSNFTRSPIETEDGHFESIEGYWYWLGCTHPDRDVLRDLYGYKAKQVGRDLGSPDWMDDETFKSKIKKALDIKIAGLPWDLVPQFYNKKLPFTHYYVYNNKIIDVPKAKWLIDHLEVLAASLPMTLSKRS